MKITTFLILITLMQASAEIKAQNINLSYNNVPLKKLFKEIKAQTGYNFIYAEGDLRDTKPVTIHVNSGKIDDVLDQIFKGQPLTYIISSKTVVVKVPPQTSDRIRSETSSISGTVTDENGKPMAGVTVTVLGSRTQTATDSSGRFALRNLDKDAEVQFSFIGYGTQRFKISQIKGNVLSVVLKQTANVLNEVVMVGYGSSKRKDLTGAVSSVKMDNIKNTPFATIDQALSGQASGVQVVQGDGSPGGMAKIRIRGGASLIGGNDPLYVIDGVQMTITNRYIQAGADITNPVENLTNDPSGSTSVGSSFSRGLNTLAGLNINDIESIDILKDASATAIFGSKAANGVVIITTKKGLKNQKPTLEANYFQAYSTARTQKVLNASQYAALLKEGATNLNKALADLGRSSNPIADSILQSPTYFGTANTNWIGLVTRTGVTQNADVSVRGGGTGSRYYTSLSYNHQTGNLLGTDFSRIAGKVNLDNEITDRLRLITNLDYGFTQNNITNGIYTSALLAPPILTPFNADGTPKIFVPTSFGSSIYSGVQNPFNLLQGKNYSNTDLLLGSLSLEYSITNTLKFKSTASVNYTNYHQQNYVPSTVYISGTNTSSNGGIATQGQTQQTNVFYENTLTWDKQFNNDNRITLLGGTSWQKSKSNSFSASGEGFPDNDLLTGLSSAALPLPPQQVNNQNSLLSFYLRANYAYQEKYLLTVTGRSDASSKFPVNNRVGYFPSAGLAWLLNEERFLKNVSWLNLLKLRISAGYTGTQNIGDNLFYTLYTPGSYAGANSLIASQLGNDKIKWETTLQKDAGLDFAMFGSRLQGSIGYYEKRSTDLLMALPVATSSGFSSVLENFATIRNRGIEIDLRGDILKGKDFQWNAALNISANRSKVLRLNQSVSDPLGIPQTTDPVGNSLFLGNSILTVGQPVGLIYGVKYLGVLRTQAEVDEYKKIDLLSQYGLRPYLGIGDAKYQLFTDGNYKGFEQRMVIGHAEPKFFGGFTNTFTYKRFSLMTLLTFSYGGDLLYQPRINNIGLGDQTNHDLSILDHYSASNTTSNNPRMVLGVSQIAQSDAVSTLDVFSASYLKLKSLTFSYQLPQSFTDKLHIHNAFVYVAGNNLLILTKYPGPDPEVSNNPYSLIGGYTDDASYPTVRQYSFGLRVGF
ncbi:TonB-dependent receptor [Mucilaginibacter sp. KACC 22773]|uniref:TonB-dependent receptor n=1 Tax=Mucilaginibacter sp. KACC 22773 TaxID=3025671 RepID=UPI0023669F3E|nr:TonB-dependent receptor [Mucilaginibacter sp. KACC 22773]WDF77131.1 TonB-dependent receptor [Mucilaginibacter sp. KACC 22773]